MPEVEDPPSFSLSGLPAIQWHARVSSMLVAIVIGIVGFFAGEGLYLLANDKTPSLDMHVWGTIGAVAAGYLGYLYDHHIRKDAN